MVASRRCRSASAAGPTEAAAPGSKVTKVLPKKSKPAGKQPAGSSGGGSKSSTTKRKKAKKAVTVAASEPYPSHKKPSSEDCAEAVTALASMHGLPSVRHKVKEESKTVLEECHSTTESVLDSLVKTILSQNTTDVQSSKGFRALKAVYPTWDAVRLAPAAAVEAPVKSCGLAEIKVARIQSILNTLMEEKGECTLEYVRKMSEEEVKTELCRFNGVGPKTAACVLMFTLGRAEFPVDTHVWRISKQQGWVPAAATRETTYEHMNKRVPDELKYDLHCLLVEHGKRCLNCAKGGKPRFTPLGECPLVALARAKKQKKRAAGSPARSLATTDGKKPAEVRAIKTEPVDFSSGGGGGEAEMES